MCTGCFQSQTRSQRQTQRQRQAGDLQQGLQQELLQYGLQHGWQHGLRQGAGGQAILLSTFTPQQSVLPMPDAMQLTPRQMSPIPLSQQQGRRPQPEQQFIILGVLLPCVTAQGTAGPCSSYYMPFVKNWP